MKRIFVIFFTFAILTGAAAAASAQDMPPQGPPSGGFGQGGGGMRFQMPQFSDLDKNKDKKISRDEWQGPPQFFDRLDTNKDGFIDETEWNAIRQRMGQGGPRLGESLAKLLDADHDGKVSRDEFAKLLTLFDLLDANHDGSLTQEEMNGFFRAVGDAQTQAQNQSTGGVDVNNLFANSDKNKDGKLTADEVANERLFKALDLNKDGTVTREEAETALKQLAERAKAKKQTP